MQTNQSKASVESVGRAIVRQENRLSSLLNHAPVGWFGRFTGRIACGERFCRIRPQEPQTLTTNGLGLNLSSGRWGGRWGGFDAIQQCTSRVILWLGAEACPRAIRLSFSSPFRESPVA